jgi:putative zinc finger/helix-turn-helix YgiT family protein
MRRCPICREGMLSASTERLRLTVAGRTFTEELEALRCEACGEAVLPALALERFELAAASELARSGPVTGEVFCFVRKALGLPAAELARLLDLRPETLSRWEHDRLPIDRVALALLGSAAEDRLAERPGALERLRALATSKRAPSRVTLRTAAPPPKPARRGAGVRGDRPTER